MTTNNLQFETACENFTKYLVKVNILATGNTFYKNVKRTIFNNFNFLAGLM